MLFEGLKWLKIFSWLSIDLENIQNISPKSYVIIQEEAISFQYIRYKYFIVADFNLIKCLSNLKDCWIDQIYIDATLNLIFNCLTLTCK